MVIETKPGAIATFPDGSTETWTTGEGVQLSGEALAAFVRICLVPKPVSVEVVEIPIQCEQPEA